MAEDLQEMTDMGDLDADMMMDDEGEASLFWSLKVPATGTTEIEEPAIPGYIIHVTKACFGPKVTNGSRSVVMCAVEEGEDEKPAFSPIACLKANNTENVDLDLVYGESAVFKIEGTKPCDVWLTGHLRPGFEAEADGPIPSDYMEMMRGDEFEELDGDGDGEDIKLDDDESPAQKKRKMNSGQPKVTAKANATPNGNNNNNKSKKNKKSPKNKPVAAPDNQNNNNNNKNKSKKQKQKNKQSPKQKPATPATPAAEEKKAEPKQQPQADKKKKQKGKKKNMAGGIQYKDVREGDGSAIKKGDRVYVYYIGQLVSNQKIFDKTLSGEGFSFTVGAGEVIKGWDMGLIGMKGNGSKRKLWIPAKLGYGNEEQEKIPANSKLLFTIEVKKVE